MRPSGHIRCGLVKGVYVDDSRSGIYTLGEIGDLEFKPLKWLIKGVLPMDGVTIISSAPKTGKSMLVYSMLLDAVGGKPILGISTLVRPLRVLYLDLENSLRTVQSRLVAKLGSSKYPTRMDIANIWPRVGAGFYTRLDRYLLEHKIDLLVVDTFGEITRDRGAQPYNYFKDKQEINKMRNMAKEHNFGIIIIHHNRKAEAADWVSLFSGTSGITGTCDTLMCLERPRGDSKVLLHVTGRDVPEETYELHFKPEDCSYFWCGMDSTLHNLSEQRKNIITYLREHNGPANCAEISKNVQKGLDPVRRLLANMVSDGQIIRVGRGKYVDRLKM